MGLKLIKDLGRLYPTEKSKQKTRFAIYECVCGKHFKAAVNSVKTKHTKSCGCLKNALISKSTSTHNLSNTRLHSIWQNMKQRCYYKKSTSYSRYGKIGVKVCDSWKKDFMSFYSWAISHGYSDELTIDRINNNGNYEPTNCRWSDKKIQARNTKKRRINNTTGYRGVNFNKKTKKYMARINVSKPIYLGLFSSALEAAKAYDSYVIKNNLEHTKNFDEA